MIRLISASLICSFFAWGCQSRQDKSYEELRTVIIGEIPGYNELYEKAEFSFRDIFDERKNHTAIEIVLEKSGTFRIDTLLPYPQEINTEYGSIYCYPGDSLHLTVEYFNITDVQGTSGELNNDLRKFIKELPRYVYSGKEYKDSVYNLSPLAYEKHIQQRELEYFQLFEDFKSGNKTSPEFDNWVHDILKSESWYDLILYLYVYAYRNDIRIGDLEIPDSYFSFMEDKDIWSFSLYTDYRVQFLEALYQYTFMKSAELEEEVRRYFDQQDTASGVRLHMAMIEKNTKGLVRELFYSRYYYSYLRMKDIRFFDTFYNPERVTNESFKAVIDSEYKLVQQYIQNLNTPGANILTSVENINSDVLKSIIDPYRGKVVYMDFWAPWCSPCMREMEYSKKIQESFKEEDVTFLFLGCNCNKENWEETITDKELRGEHILLTGDQYSELREFFEIGGIPHYALIDRMGNIVSKNAFRPSSGEYLKQEIFRLLKENKH